MHGSAAHGFAGEASNGRDADSAHHATFSDVARAHFRWDVEARGSESRERALDAYREKLDSFEADSGHIIEAYWCRKHASGVALAQTRASENGRHLGLVERLVKREHVPDYRLYRVTDWETADTRRLADLLHDCDILAIKATWGLEGIQRAVVMQWLLAVEAHVLGFAETHGSGAEVGAHAGAARTSAESELDAFHAKIYAELSRIEDYYQLAGEKRARLHYVEGMLLFGVPAVAAVGVLSALILGAFGLLHLHAEGVRQFYACMGAGAMGAIMSVLIRMGGRRGGFTTDHELGSVGVRRLGAFRPLIGAISGVIVYFLVQTSLVPIDESALTFPFYVVVAFLAGFSERWTKVVLDGAMRTIEKVGGGDGSAADTG